MEYNLDVSFKHLNEDQVNGILSCGYLRKTAESRVHNFIYYGGFLVLSGSGTYVGGDGVSLPIGVGDFVQRQPGVIHTTTVDASEPWVEFYVCFGPDLYKTLVEMNLLSNQPILHTNLSQETMKKCELLLYNFKKAKDKDLGALLLQVQNYMFYMNALHVEADNRESTMKIIEAICEVLSKDFERKIDIKYLADKYQIGYETLRKTFKKKIGVSIYQYRIMKRVNEAKRLLCYPDSSIKEIAESLGYTDQYAFSNQFKKVTGVSPKKFRQTL